MDFSEIRENFLEKINSLKDRIIELVSENKKVAIIIAALTGVILLCIILLLCTIEKKDDNNGVIKQELILTENLIIPNGPDIPEDYNLSRQTQEKWTEEEATMWFTVPGIKEIETLSKTNDKIVKEIIGAAP